MVDLLTDRVMIARFTHTGLMVGIALLLVVAGLVVVQVMARNLLDLGLPWADELARFAGIGLVFLSVPCLAGRQVLVSVSLLPDALPPSPRHWLVLLADMATLAFAGLLLWSLAAFLPRAGKFLTPAMGLPNWFYYSLALVGSVLLALIALSRVVVSLRGQAPTALQAEPGNRDEPAP